MGEVIPVISFVIVGHWTLGLSIAVFVVTLMRVRRSMTSVTAGSSRYG